jgi:hypothetical protein
MHTHTEAFGHACALAASLTRARPVPADPRRLSQGCDPVTDADMRQPAATEVDMKKAPTGAYVMDFGGSGGGI